MKITGVNIGDKIETQSQRYYDILMMNKNICLYSEFRQLIFHTTKDDMCRLFYQNKTVLFCQKILFELNFWRHLKSFRKNC